MALMIGAILGLCGFLAVLVLGIWHEIPFSECIVRATTALGVGWLLGWLLFGPMGLILARESAGPLGKRVIPEGPDKDKEEGKKETEEEKGLPEGEEPSTEPAPSEEPESDR